ncbi:MAG: FAD:protein FMN transferase [Gammaproteobacteria bacterium]
MPSQTAAAPERRRIVSGVLACLAAALLAGCGRPQPALHEQQFFAFGTLITVSLYDVDATLAHRAFTDLRALFNQKHRDWHAWEPGPLTELNQALAERGEAAVPATLQPLLASARRLSLASDGLFNPAIGGLLALWGFQDDTPPTRPPAPAAVAAQLAQHPSMADLELHGTRVSTGNRAVALDLGAFAKGYVAQLGAEHLRRLGVEHALIAVAGDIHALGRHGERAWRVGIRHPRGAGILAATDLHDGESISTSGDYERYFEFEGRRYHHLLDPRSGQPARGAIAVTVIARDGASADAAASALFIADAQDWPRLARALGVDQVMRVEADGGVVHLSPAMAARLRIEAEPAPEVRVQALP